MKRIIAVIALLLLIVSTAIAQPRHHPRRMHARHHRTHVRMHHRPHRVHHVRHARPHHRHHARTHRMHHRAHRVHR